MDKGAKIYVAGHRGLVGSALVRTLRAQGYANLVVRTSGELDLRVQQAVNDLFRAERPEYVLMAAARAGGILANDSYPAFFIADNLMIQTNVIDAARVCGVKKLLFLGSSCIYPRDCPQPMREEYLLTGPLERTNHAYAVAKIAGIEMCQSYNRQYGTNFIAVMPTNLYGPGDNFDLATAHVIPALVRKFHEAKRRQAAAGADPVVLWGTGSPLREFLHCDDLAEACVFLMNTYDSSEILNIGTGEEVSVKALAQMIREVVGYEGDVVWDTSRPDGTPRKLLDVSRLHRLGWRHKISLEEGLRRMYRWYQESAASPRGEPRSAP